MIEKNSSAKFKRKYGVSQNIFDKMLEIIELADFEKRKQGSKPSKLTISELVYDA